ncbi:RNA-binding protein 12-like isoform X1 [Paramormyrops kingsleyae]|uniref:RNA-binding protein 12-like isoform X1 n=1 Tax=Paramormyrops kingsleyae TaxID=1676925 RepID=UPI000CD6100F|nr:RNA-binding protein 12-like isoform X1 [Paramormyrops kingsleyae]XP_023693640.1 RNA-binding protein 12-like isoform X1 [Paramormyrops kingsleyae]
MAVVIRLQGLPIVAGTMDIRHFFSGLTIPDGGVHIVGGEHGEAFIVFATDEDARLGMMRTGGTIKGSKVSLLLSSKTEMQNMIELSRRRFETGNSEGPAGNGRSGPPVSSGGSGRSSLPTTMPGFSNPSPTTVTTTSSIHESVVSNKNVSTFTTTSMASMPPSFSNNFGSPSLTMGSTMTTAMSTLNSVPPPIPPLPTLPSLPPMPSIPPMPVPPPVSSLPPVPAVTPLTPVPPVPPMTHMPHISTLPPFNPGVPPPVGPVTSGLSGSGPPLSIGNPSHMFLGPLNPLGPLNIQAPLKSTGVSPDELYIHLQGLPFSATEMDVRDFFQGLGVDSVRFLRDHLGRSNGKALVKFFTPQDTFEALKRNNGMIGQRYVDMTPVTERQWLASGGVSSTSGGQGLDKHASSTDHDQHRRTGSSSESPSGRERARSRSPHKQEYCVYLKGLPYEVENKQIFDFFKNLDIIEDSIYIAYGPNGRATGEGFVEFRNENDYKVALSCHMQFMGSRFIQVHPITKKGMFEKIDIIRKRMQGSQGDQKGSSLEGGGKGSRTCAHISNIPYNVSKKDVRLFLEGIQLFEESLKVLVDGNGNGLGQAIVQFRSEEEALKAERLHRQKLNGRDAFVHLVTFDQMKEIERNPPPQVKRGQKSQGNVQTHVPGHTSSHAYPTMAGDEYSFLRNSVGGLNNGPPFVTPFSGPGNGLGGPPPPMPPIAGALGEVPLNVPPPMVASHLPGPVLEPPGFRPGPGGNSGPPGFGPDGMRGIPPFDNGPRKSGAHPVRGGGQGRAGGAQAGFAPGSEAMRGPSGISGGPGSQRPTIVKIQNMPFTVTVDEILDFFYGYQVLPGSVCLQYSEKGMPTGEAMVAFESHDEAMSAVLDLNDRPIGSRKVKITLG